MKLVQRHRRGYFAPPIYKSEDELIEMYKRKLVLAARFPEVWLMEIKK